MAIGHIEPARVQIDFDLLGALAGRVSVLIGAEMLFREFEEHVILLHHRHYRQHFLRHKRLVAVGDADLGERLVNVKLVKRLA